MIVNHSQQPKIQTNKTFATTLEFAEAWSKSFVNYQPSKIPTKWKFADRYQPLAISVTGSGAPRTMYAIESLDKFGRRDIALAPFGLFASPEWENELEKSTLKKILDRLLGIKTKKLLWHVRFDHQPLATGLISLGLKFDTSHTHVLDLDKDYENTFTNYSSSTRNQIRKAKRQGVVVEDVLNSLEVDDYYQIHTQLAQQKGDYKFIYPIELFLNMITLRSNMRMLVAKSEGKVIAGGLFFKDGCSVKYWQGTADRNYSYLYPMRAVLNEAIRWACDLGVTYFDFGDSAGITSLEKFKSSWGAQPRQYWIFEWHNPLWQEVRRINNNFRQLLKNTINLG
jgi:lipid II:glycine glycyltransferase (peptidoglycan interpeptide bridge formation enzyme)